MKRKTKKRKLGSDEPFGKLTAIDDFLPPPQELLPQEEKQKITLVLDLNTVRFFKSQARRNKVKYQRMMREVLRGYARKYG